MRVLGISGSPKKGGLTDLLLDKVLAGAKSAGSLTEKIILNDIAFRPCQECGGCDETGVCVLEDGMKAVYDKLLYADRLVIASPIYFGNVTAQLKAMIDRCHSLWMAKYILKNGLVPAKKRKGIFLCVTGKETEEYFDYAKKVVKIFFTVLNIEYSGELFIKGLNDMPSDSPKRKEALSRAYEMGISLVR